MKQVLYTISGFLIIAIFAVLITIVLCQEAGAFEYDGDYQSNYDGDSINFTLEVFPDMFILATTRLFGVDTPEMRGAKCEIEKILAHDAKQFVETVLTDAEDIRVVVLGQGKYGRYLVSVYADDEDLATQLVSAGLGRAYDGKKREGWCN